MLDTKEAKELILSKLLGHELTTGAITTKTKIHRYRVEKLLDELLNEDKVLCDKKEYFTFWKKA